MSFHTSDCTNKLTRTKGASSLIICFWTVLEDCPCLWCVYVCVVLCDWRVCQQTHGEHYWWSMRLCCRYVLWVCSACAYACASVHVCVCAFVPGEGNMDGYEFPLHTRTTRTRSRTHLQVLEGWPSKPYCRVLLKLARKVPIVATRAWKAQTVWITAHTRTRPHAQAQATRSREQ